MFQLWKRNSLSQVPFYMYFLDTFSEFLQKQYMVMSDQTGLRQNTIPAEKMSQKMTLCFTLPSPFPLVMANRSRSSRKQPDLTSKSYSTTIASSRIISLHSINTALHSNSLVLCITKNNVFPRIMCISKYKVYLLKCWTLLVPFSRDMLFAFCYNSPEREKKKNMSIYRFTLAISVEKKAFAVIVKSDQGYTISH